MGVEIGHISFTATLATPPATGAASPAPPPPATDTADVIPASPPPEVLEEVAAAAARAERLHAEGRELHFRKDERSGRIVVEVRDLDGRVIRTIPPSEALDFGL